jgi:YegS/Rv2252/BmrU family lipid kinase
MPAMPDPTGWFIIVNSVSGGGRARRRWPRLRAALQRLDIAHQSVTTSSPGEAIPLARDAIARGHRRLLALGGDGSFNELVNGALAQDRVPLGQLLVSVAPLGTGNDWARAMQVPDDVDALAAAMSRTSSRHADLGVAQAPSATGALPARQAFHNVAGAGLDAEVLRGTPRGGPRLLAYLVGLARALARYRAPQFALTVDGRSQSGRYWIALAAIGPSCGGGMRLAPAASLDDGYFDLVTIEPMPLRRLIRNLPRLFDGRLTGDSAVRQQRCRSVTIESDPPCGVELDGDVFGATPMTFSLAPGALTVLDCRGLAK